MSQILFIFVSRRPTRFDIEVIIARNAQVTGSHPGLYSIANNKSLVGQGGLYNRYYNTDLHGWGHRDVNDSDPIGNYTAICNVQHT